MSRPAEELPEKVTVSFYTGHTGILDMKNPRAVHWARIIDERQRANQPVYVEIDEDTGVITGFRVPWAYKVERLDLDDHGNLRVRLQPSHAIHLLLRSDPNFDAMRESLQAALADGSERLITETRDEHEIIDVRQLEAEPAESYGPAPSVLPDPPVSEERAGEVFNNMNAESCSLSNPNSECIPFMYPDDGCWIRAHIMCHLMRSGGPDLATNPPEDPGKVWIHAHTILQVPTANHPDCRVTWGWHVAPTLTTVPLPDPPAGAPPDDPAREKYRVIDPSLSLAPEKEAAWHGRQGDPKARLTDTPWTDYNSPGDNRSVTLEQAHKDMKKYRDEFNDRCADLGGPPPYSCTPSCFFIIDRSTFSKNEVEAMLQLSNPAVVESAFYIVVEGFSPYDLGFTAAIMQHTPLGASQPVAGMTIMPVRLAFEYPTHLNRRQRLTWIYDVSFTNINAFTSELITVTLQAAMSTVSSTGYLYLTTQPNPYENDGPTSWLSTDLRVFQISTGQSKFGVPMGSDPNGFITQVITNLNSGNTGGQTFENDISTDQQTSRLELSGTVHGMPVYNFAVAKVRYRALSASATDVRVFFRLFPVATTSLEYNQDTTYRCHTADGTSIPLLGIKNGEVAAIPCFAEPRINSAEDSMTAQTDEPNVQTLPPNPSGAEVVRYFGCWLDINQTQLQFPIQPMPVDGPYAADSDRKSIRELIRNEHQCLVSEISFTPAPIPTNATPSASDRLAQRNLAIVESANPGLMFSRRIPQTFEIRPSMGGHEHDELMIDWGNLPAGSVASLYVPGLAVSDILLLAVRKYRSHRLLRIDEHTLKMATGGITYLPIPFTDENLPGLLIVDLPEDVERGQAFKIVVRQVTGEAPPIIQMQSIAHEPSLRHIVGSFQITIPVSTKEALLKPALRQLAVLKYIAQSIPADNRWSPVFGRYLQALDNRVRALGGNPEAVLPSPAGDVQNGEPFAKDVPYIGTWLVLGPIFDPAHQPGSHLGDVPPRPRAGEIIMDIDNHKDQLDPLALTTPGSAPSQDDVVRYGGKGADGKTVLTERIYTWRKRYFGGLDWNSLNDIKDNVHTHLGGDYDDEPFDPYNYLNFAGKYHALALLLVYIISPGDRTTRIALRHDDAVRVWLNGDEIKNDALPFLLDHDIIAEDETFAEITLRSGTNVLLVAVAETHADWGFSARIEDYQGLRIMTDRPDRDPIVASESQYHSVSIAGSGNLWYPHDLNRSLTCVGKKKWKGRVKMADEHFKIVGHQHHWIPDWWGPNGLDIFLDNFHNEIPGVYDIIFFEDDPTHPVLILVKPFVAR